MKAKRQVYLDHAAATPVDPKVLKAMLPYFTEAFYNPSALYLAAKDAKQALAEARRTVAQILGVQPAGIVFTAGGTEANNIAIHGVLAQYPESSVVVSAIEHASILETAQQYPHTICPVMPSGLIDLRALRKSIDDSTVLVSVMQANNETGTIQPIAEIVTLLESIRRERNAAGNPRPLLLHTDASQSANLLALQPRKLGVDLLTLNAGKMYGPKQSGALYVKGGLKLTPLVHGGGQERGLRSGTEHVAAAVGLAKALELAQAKRHAETERLADLQNQFVKEILQHFSDAEVRNRHTLMNFVHVTFPGVDNERLVMELDERGVQCAAGSACKASSEEPSHVLRAMGVSEADAQSSVRFTMGRATTAEDIDYVIMQLTEVLHS